VLSGHVGALERRAMCARLQKVHSITHNSHGAGREAMAARATRDMWLMWHALDHGS
jgi:hypothetical protein